MASKKKPAAKGKAKAVGLKTKGGGGGGKKAWIIVGIMLAVLVGLGLQVYLMAKQQAKLKFDMIRVGRTIPQGGDKGQGMGVVNFEGDKQDNLFFLEGEGGAKPRLQKFDPMGNSIAIFEPKKVDEQLTGPRDVTTDGAGNVYVLLDDGRIHVMDNSLKFLRTFKTGIPQPVAIGCDSQGRLYVASQSGNKVHVLDKDGKPALDFGAPGTHSGDITTPTRMRVTQDDHVVVLEMLPTGLRGKVFGPDLKLIKPFEIKNLQNCPPLRMGVNGDGKIIFNDHLGSRGIVVYDVHTQKFVGDSQITKDGEKFVSPGAAGANKWTPSMYVHTVPGLIKCVMPGTGEEE